MMANTKAAPPSGESTGSQNAVQPNDFTRASKRLTEPFYDNQIALGAGAKTIQQIDLPAIGYLRNVVIDVEVSGTTGATYNPDAPYNVLQQIMLKDVNSQPIFLASGYNTYLANLLGGYAYFGDPGELPGFSQTATGFRFQLRVPVEIVARNALGALNNQNSAMTYKLALQLAPLDDVYASNGTGATARIRMTLESWAQPQAADVRGVPNTQRPPMEGTTQNWSEYAAPTLVGNNTIRLPRVGNTIRMLVFINRDNTGARTDTGIPAELSMLIDGNNWRRNSFDYEEQRIYELYGYGAAERPAGVWVLALNDDFDGKPGDEMGDFWLATSGATRLEVQGVWTAAGSLEILTNDILAYAGSGGPGQTLGIEG